MNTSLVLAVDAGGYELLYLIAGLCFFVFWCILLITCIHYGVRSGTRAMRDELDEVGRVHDSIQTELQTLNRQMAWLCDYFSRHE